MNTVIIIPTYVSNSMTPRGAGVIDTYDHMNPISRDGELVRCLSSLRDMKIELPIAILVVAEKGAEQAAEDKIRDQAAHYPELNISVAAHTEEQGLHERMKNLGLGEFSSGIALSGYGASKNFGLAYAASMGYTEVIFIDDDEVVEDLDFAENACYGLGMLTQRGVPILIKSGFYIDKNGSYKSKARSNWYDRFWQQHRGFDQWIEHAMHGPRLSSSNTACGGLLAIHREAYRRVSFDPWIARGEDLDFLFNVRMYGSEIWFDNMWKIRHLPPAISKVEAKRFAQDIYRWFYEKSKLEFSATQIDLLQIQYQNLNPYPGPFMESSIKFNTFMTAILRSIGKAGQRKGYLNAAMSARRGAKTYAKDNCSNYFAFQNRWPEIITMIEQDVQLKGIFENAAVIPMTEEQIEKVDSCKIEAQIMAQVTGEGTNPELQNDASLQNDTENVLNSKGTSSSKESFGDILKGYTKRKKLGEDNLEVSEPQDNEGVLSSSGDVSADDAELADENDLSSKVDDGEVADAELDDGEAVGDEVADDKTDNAEPDGDEPTSNESVDTEATDAEPAGDEPANTESGDGKSNNTEAESETQDSDKSNDPKPSSIKPADPNHKSTTNSK